MSENSLGYAGIKHVSGYNKTNQNTKSRVECRARKLEKLSSTAVK